MSLLNYQIYNTPASHKIVMDNIRSFAVAQGWAQVSYKTGVEWKAVFYADASSPPPTENEGDCYRLDAQTPIHSDWDGNVAYAYVEFVSGTWVVTSKRYWFAPGYSEDYLCLSSTGYGSQSLYHRFKITMTGDANSKYTYLGAQKAGSQTIDYTSSTHPVDQNNWIVTNWQYNRRWELSPSPMIKQWCFGNNKIIICCVQIDAVFCTYMIFGSPELFDTGETEGAFIQWINSHRDYRWYDYQTGPNYLYLSNRHWLYNGVRKEPKCSLGDYTQYGGVGKYQRAGNKNNWSGKRVMQKDLVYINDSADGAYFPLGIQPYLFMEFIGLVVGQTLSYGSEQYICLPIYYSRAASPNVHGIAVRIV